jgi:hypothetical protein
MSLAEMWKLFSTACSTTTRQSATLRHSHITRKIPLTRTKKKSNLVAPKKIPEHDNRDMQILNCVHRKVIFCVCP